MATLSKVVNGCQFVKWSETLLLSWKNQNHCILRTKVFWLLDVYLGRGYWGVRRIFDAMNSSIEISSYRDQHFKVCCPYFLEKTWYWFTVNDNAGNILVKLLIDNIWFNVIMLFLQGSRSEQEKLLKASSTLYIGNLSFYTTEEQIYELFSRCGDIRRVIMGLDKYKKTPCGFCFVEYYTREDSENCMRLVKLSWTLSLVNSIKILPSYSHFWLNYFTFLMHIEPSRSQKFNESGETIFIKFYEICSS